MPRLPHVTHPAPLGMDAATDPMLLPVGRAQFLQNLGGYAAGALSGMGLSDLLRHFASPIDGMHWHYGVTPEADRLLLAEGGVLWQARPVLPLTNPPTFLTWSIAGSGFETGARVRFVTYGGETIVVQEGGIQPKRFDGEGLYQLGITPPDAPTVITVAPPTGSSNKTAAVTRYVSSYADARLRESSPSAVTSVDYSASANSGNIGRIRVEWPTDPQVTTIYVYATTGGGSIYYRIATLTHRSQVVVEDNLADNTINTGSQAPAQGQYDVPQQASVVAIHKNHVLLNSTEDEDTLQINNLDSPTQWASISTAATDGVRLSIQSHQADAINAIIPFGSLSHVCKRSGTWLLWGDTPTDFQLRKVHEQGTVAPDSATRCDNMVCVLLSDGVYRSSFQDGFLLTKFSEEIDPLLEDYLRSAEGRASYHRAAGQFYRNQYHLAIGDRMFIFDFDAPGWRTFRVQ